VGIADLSGTTNDEKGVPPEWRDKIWPSFEKGAADLLCAALVELKADARRRKQWDERLYSWCVLLHMERLCRHENLPYSPRYDHPMISDEDIEKGKSPKAAPLLDLLVRWNKDVAEIYFGIEAKILVGKKVGSHKPWDTVNEYIEEGMRRYVDGKYARELPTAAMLGYVLSGECSEIVARINDQIDTLKFPCTKKLAEHTDTLAPDGNYESAHPRTDLANIRVLHLFVMFGVGNRN
jgi:hypothetical protein